MLANFFKLLFSILATLNYRRQELNSQYQESSCKRDLSVSFYCHWFYEAFLSLLEFSWWRKHEHKPHSRLVISSYRWNKKRYNLVPRIFVTLVQRNGRGRLWNNPKLLFRLNNCACVNVLLTTRGKSICFEKSLCIAVTLKSRDCFGHVKDSSLILVFGAWNSSIATNCSREN